MTAPILTAETILTDALIDAFTPLVDTYQGAPKAYYQMADSGAPLPFLVFQCQADIGRLDFLGDIGATVLITVKAFSRDRYAAHTLLASAAAAMGSLTYAGYGLRAIYVSSPSIPAQDLIYQAAHLYRIYIERT